MSFHGATIGPRAPISTAPVALRDEWAAWRFAAEPGRKPVDMLDRNDRDQRLSMVLDDDVFIALRHLADTAPKLTFASVAVIVRTTLHL